MKTSDQHLRQTNNHLTTKVAQKQTNHHIDFQEEEKIIIVTHANFMQEFHHGLLN